MTEEERAKMDAEQDSKLDRLLRHMDSLSSRMDAYEDDRRAEMARRMAEETEQKAKKDGEEEDEQVGAENGEDGETEEPVGEKPPVDRKKAGNREGTETEITDAARRDAKRDAMKSRRDAMPPKLKEGLEEHIEEKSDEESEEERTAALRKADEKKRADADTETRKKIAELEARMPREMSDEDMASMADAQAKCDSVAQLFGESAPRALRGESLLAYRRRMLTKYQKHSRDWAKTDLTKIADPGAFDVIEARVYADAEQAARSPVDLPFGQLRELRSTDRAGRVTSTFVGDPNSWMADFKAAPKYVQRFNTRTGV